MKRLVFALVVATFVPTAAFAGGGGNNSSSGGSGGGSGNDRYERGEHTKGQRGSTWDKHSGRHDSTKEKKRSDKGWQDRSGKRKSR